MTGTVHSEGPMASDIAEAKSDARNHEDLAAIEKITSGTGELEKDHAEYGRMDKELANYAEGAAIEIDPEESR